MENIENEEECTIHSVINIEDFLKDNNFQLDTYYGWNKRYVKEITEYQNLYVRIFSDINKIIDVEYENLAMTKHEKYGIISFETIENIKQLKHLLKALKRYCV
jgi:hypothetical protein